jgi:hypothetical protein
MACKQSIPAVISCKPPSPGGHVRARSLAAALTLGAWVALNAVIAIVSSAAAQELEWVTSAGSRSGPTAGHGLVTDPAATAT